MQCKDTLLVGLQIAQLTASMRQARMRSAVELLGRKQLAPGEELPLTPADPASRILEALLDVPDQAQRLQMLPEALQAPDAVSPAAEVLSRSPESDLTIFNDMRPSSTTIGLEKGVRKDCSSGWNQHSCGAQRWPHAVGKLPEVFAG